MAWQTLDQQYAQQADKNDRSNYLKDIITGLSIASNNRPDTLLGYGLGRWLTNYVNRGLERRQQEKNQEALDTAMQGLMGPAVVPGNVVEAPASNRSVANNARQIAAEMYPNAQESAAKSLMPNTNWLERAQTQEYFPMNGGDNGSSVAQEIASRMTGIPQQPTTNILNMTSEDYYQQAYNVARKAGSTEEQARKFAQQRAGQYQTQRVNALSNAFINGGVDADGTITRQGVGVLAQLAQENPAQVNMLGNMFQTPQGATKNAQDIAKMMQNSNLHLNNAREMAALNYDLGQRAADAQIGRNMQMANYQQQLRQAEMMQRAEYAAQGAYQQARMDAMQNGATPEQANAIGQTAAQMAYYALLSGGYGGGGRGGNGRGNAGTDNGKADDARYKRLKDWIDGYEKANFDSLSGEWRPGTGPDDPEYKKRKRAFDSFTDSESNKDKFDFDIPTDDPAEFAKTLRPILHENGVPEYLIDGYIQRAWMAAKSDNFTGYNDLKKLKEEDQ